MMMPTQRRGVGQDVAGWRAWSSPCRKDVFYRPRMCRAIRMARIGMDRKLLDILACPATRQPLSMLEPRGLAALNRAIAAGGIHRADG